MKAVLVALALTSICLADQTFYPKATGQGQAVNANKEVARFSLKCIKRAPEDYQASLVGGIKVVVTTPQGIKRTLNMPEVEDANFLDTRCSMVGKGTLTLDYGKGQTKQYEGSIRATVIQNMVSDRSNQSPDTVSIAFWSPDMKVPQVNFQGTVKEGQITVTHPPLAIPTRPPTTGN